jgi:hypothetical protein
MNVEIPPRNPIQDSAFRRKRHACALRLYLPKVIGTGLPVFFIPSTYKFEIRFWRHYRIAIGLPGEPEAPTNRMGVNTNKNS